MIVVSFGVACVASHRCVYMFADALLRHFFFDRCLYVFTIVGTFWQYLVHLDIKNHATYFTLGWAVPTNKLNSWIVPQILWEILSANKRNACRDVSSTLLAPDITIEVCTEDVYLPPCCAPHLYSMHSHAVVTQWLRWPWLALHLQGILYEGCLCIPVIKRSVQVAQAFIHQQKT